MNALDYQAQTPQHVIDDDLLAACETWEHLPVRSVGEMIMRSGSILICAAALSHPVCEDCGCGHAEDDEPSNGH